MANVPDRGLLSSGLLSPTSDGKERLRDLASRFEKLLEQAEGFVRGGDYLGAQARARYAHEELAQGAVSARVADVDIVELRRHLDLRLRHYDRLARDWQRQNTARHTAYLVREREAIGAIDEEARPTRAGPTNLTALFRRLWTVTFGSWSMAMRMGCAR